MGVLVGGANRGVCGWGQQGCAHHTWKWLFWFLSPDPLQPFCTTLEGLFIGDIIHNHHYRWVLPLQGG